MTHLNSFSLRHLGPRGDAQKEMLQFLGLDSPEDLVKKTVPTNIRVKNKLNLPRALTEHEAIREFRTMMQKNEVYRSYIGMGYVGTITPPVIQRNILENPGWYTQYTPYQSEIAQGRLEALLNFQTMIMEYTGLEIANASLLDEGTAAAEAMALAFNSTGKDHAKKFWVADDCHPQTIEVVKTRAKFLGVEIEVGSVKAISSLPVTTGYFGALFQYPNTYGDIVDYTSLTKTFQNSGALVTLACDLMALTLLKTPGEMGADIAVGNTQCFGVPMGYGGPHAAFLATKDAHKRLLPGRIVGVSKDSEGNPAIRLALQTREQHIRRDKATSNICTAQVLLAIMASMYAVYHGPEGIRQIAEEIALKTERLRKALASAGFTLNSTSVFNTLKIISDETKIKEILKRAEGLKINFRKISSTSLGITIDETMIEADLQDVLSCFGVKSLSGAEKSHSISAEFLRKTPFLTQSIFKKVRSETEMLRYLAKLQSKDLSLAYSMIPLGSCTMKLNATTEMLPVTWAEVGTLHPFVPKNQAKGYAEMFQNLEAWLSEITGFDAVSLQPNAGSQGEYAGLLVIKQFLENKGEKQRDVCLIPQSAHGTNPASAAMAGFKVVVVNCDREGNVDLEDLRKKADENASRLGALMVTYPSTHGVFEEGIREICEIVHRQGGQVYMDGANMNAQVGLCRPGDFGPDVCHLNLHKTFCIPHGGGGPGMGPIGVKSHLAPFLPNHPVVEMGGKQSVGPVSAAPWGSASILPISYLYIQMMGEEGLTRATEVAILNANYIARKLEGHYPILYRGKNETVAHECIVDFRPLKEKSGVEVEDVAKRLMDYGFHAPTVSFPVAGTMMIEPTESESKEELDRFIHAMISIRSEIEEVVTGKADRAQNLLKLAPHTAAAVTATEWTRPYTRERAAFPAPWVKEWKFWPSVARIDNVYGERNLNCSCAGIEEYR
jgi:glycine dehydrogenase